MPFERRHVQPVAVGPDRQCLTHLDEVRAENPCLLLRPLRQFSSGDPALEAEVVADPRAGSRLAADRLPLDHERAQALGGGVHGCGQPRRSGADDRDVELARPLEVGGGAVGVGDLDVGRVDEDPAVPLYDDRCRPGWLANLLEDLRALGRGRGVEDEGDPVAGQQAA